MFGYLNIFVQRILILMTISIITSMYELLTEEKPEKAMVSYPRLVEQVVLVFSPTVDSTTVAWQPKAVKSGESSFTNECIIAS